MITVGEFTDQIHDTIELVKQGKLEVDKAKVIAELGKVMASSFKTQVDAFNVMAKAENPNATKAMIDESGFMKENKKVLKIGE